MKNIMQTIKKYSQRLGRTIKAHPWWTTIIVLVIVGGGWRWWRRTNQESEETATIETLVPVRRQDINETIEVSGTISSANYTQVQTQAIGTVSEIYVQEGDYVKEGDKLFELELTPEGKQSNQSAYASYLSAQNSLKNAENQLNSLQVTLFDKNKYFMDHAVEEELDESDPDWIMQNADWLAAENSYKNQTQVIAQARANVSSAYQNYRNTGAVVYAPASGVVENITAVLGLSFGSVSSGSGISLSDRLATIKTGEQVLAIFTVSATDILKIELGQSVTLNSSNLPNEYEGEVVSVDRYGKTGTTTTYQVIAQFDTTTNDNTQALLPNLSVDGEILVSQKSDALVVPTLAITTQGTRSLVNIRTNDGQTEVREVQTGVTSGNLTEIISGVEEGEQVVFSLAEFSSEASTMRMMGEGMMGGGAPPQGGGNRGGNGGNQGGPR